MATREEKAEYARRWYERHPDWCREPHRPRLLRGVAPVIRLRLGHFPIDRRDPAIGYTRENCRLAYSAVKNTWNDEVVLELAEALTTEVVE